MPSFSGGVLSGSTNGRPIKVAATSIGSGTTIHTGTSSTTGFDEVTLYVSNTDTSERTLTLGWGGTTDPDDLVCKAVTIPASSGPIPIAVGRINNSLVIRAAASSANVLLITGFYNRST